MTKQEKLLDKILKLRSLAEGSSFPEEATQARKMADVIQSENNITEESLANHKIKESLDINSREEIVAINPTPLKQKSHAIAILAQIIGTQAVKIETGKETIFAVKGKKNASKIKEYLSLLDEHYLIYRDVIFKAFERAKMVHAAQVNEDMKLSHHMSFVEGMLKALFDTQQKAPSKKLQTSPKSIDLIESKQGNEDPQPYIDPDVFDLGYQKGLELFKPKELTQSLENSQKAADPSISEPRTLKPRPKPKQESPNNGSSNPILNPKFGTHIRRSQPDQQGKQSERGDRKQ